MFNIRYSFILLLIVPLIAACSDSGSEVAVLPTRVIIPTETETATPIASATPTASETPLPPSATPTTAATETPLPTLTEPPPTATLTNTPTATRVRPTNTFTLTPRPSATATASQTPLPTATVTPNAPQIIRFEASQTQASANTSITLTWESVGDIARIDQLSINGAVQNTFSVPPTGQLPVVIPQVSDSQVIYRLTITRNGLDLSRSLPIIVNQSCATPWFFGDNIAPEGSGCPAGPPLIQTGKLQLFERGIMITLNVNGQNRVYGFATANGRYASAVNAWDGTSTYTAPCGSAPSGLITPSDVFNWAYNNTNGTVGLWCDLTNGIGWAVAPPNLNAQLTIQFEANQQNAFVQIPGYGVLRLVGTIDGGTWIRIQ